MGQDDLLVVTDTLLDKRFVNDPMVTGEFSLRFFASMPLVNERGEKIGALSILDIKPRILNSHQQMMLKILSNQVMKIVELRAGVKLLEKNYSELQEQKKLNNDANIRLRSFFESSTNFQVLLGKHGEIIDFNKTAYNFIKTVHKASVQRGRPIDKILSPRFCCHIYPYV